MKKPILIFIIVFLLLSVSALGENVTRGHGDTPQSLGAENTIRGICVGMNQTRFLDNITLYSAIGCAVGTCKIVIWNVTTSTCGTGAQTPTPIGGDFSVLPFDTGVSTTIKFGNGMQLMAGNYYAIGITNTAGNYNMEGDLSITIPVTHPEFHWFGSFQSGTGDFSSNTTGGAGFTTASRLNIASLGLSNFSGPPPAPTGISINYTNPLPTNNTQYINNLISFNVSVDAKEDHQFNVSLYINGTFNVSRNISGGGKNINIEFNLTMPDGSYTYYFNLTDNTTSKQTDDNATFFVDSVNPTITYFTPADANNTFVYGNFVSNILISDNNLFRYQFNITNPSKTLNIFNITNSSLDGLTSTTINYTFNMGIYSGLFLTTTRVCDSHTAEEISFGDVRKTKDELIFDGVKIYEETKSDTFSMNTQYKRDRYSFDFVTKSVQNTKSFIVESNKPIEIVPNSEYKGHLVTGNKWVDFETFNIKSATMQRITSNKVRVIIEKNYATNVWEFNSIGELNCIETVREFFSLNSTLGFTSPILLGDTNTLTLNVSYNASHMGKITAILNYAGSSNAVVGVNETTNYLFTSIIDPTSAGLKTFNWTFNVEGTEYLTESITQNITTFDIDNCSTYSTQFINFTVRGEKNGSILEADIDYFVSFGNGVITGTYNNSATNKSNLVLCMSPESANLTGDFLLQYSASTHDTREWISDSRNIDNVTDNVNLYLLSSADSGQITIHVIDDEDNNLDGVLVESYRYDIDNDRDILVSTAATDSSGNVLFNLEKGSAFYSFKFYQEGVLQLSTIRFKLFADTYEYTLSPSVVSRLAEWLSLDSEITSDITYSNTTNFVTFTWSYGGSLADLFCLNITDFNQTYYGNCTTSTTDTMTFQITRFNISYTAIATARTTTGNSYVIKRLAVNTLEFFRRIKKEIGIFLTIIVFLTMSLLGLGTGNKSITLISAMLAIMVVAFMQISALTVAIASGFVAIGVIGLIIISRRSSP